VILLRSRSARRAARSTLLGIVDQVASSATNFLVVASVARGSGTVKFGQFALGVALVALAVSLNRAFTLEPMFVKAQSDEEGHLRDGAEWLSLALGLMAAFLVLPIGVVAGVGPLVGATLFALCASLWQDAMRYRRFVQQQPGGALALDVTWLAVTAATLLPEGLRCSPMRGMLGWGAGAAVAATAGWLFRTHHGRVPGATVAWLRRTRGLGGPYVAEYVLSAGGSHLALVALAAISQLPAVAAVQVAQSAIGPLNIVYAGVGLVLLPMVVRRATDHVFLFRMAAAVSTVYCVSAMLYSWAVAAVPQPYLARVFGASSADGGPLVVLIGASYAVGGLSAGAGVIVRATGQARIAMLSRAVVFVPATGCPIVGALWGGVRGFSVGLIVSSALSASAWWYLCWTRILRPMAAPVEPSLGA
jgi:hypothetical protein